MKRFALLMLMLLAASPCQAADAIRLISDASQTLSVRVYTGSSTGVTASMTAGTGSNTQRYVVTDATLVTAGMPTARGNYDYIIYSSSLSNIIASGTMGWDTDQAIDVIRVGDPVYIDETAAAGLGDTFVEQLFATPTEDSGATTVGRALHYLRGAFSSASVFSANALDNAPSGGGFTIPVNQVVVPASRTWLLVETDEGLRGEESLSMKVGESKVFAFDFRKDLPTNGRLSDVDAIAIETGTSGGVTFANTATDPGVDKTQAKSTITAVTAGTYEIGCDVNYQSGDGGGVSKGVVTLIVTD